MHSTYVLPIFTRKRADPNARVWFAMCSTCSRTEMTKDFDGARHYGTRPIQLAGPLTRTEAQQACQIHQ